jgi:GH15 family glucan-1,4-alpha-glucosidase
MSGFATPCWPSRTSLTEDGLVLRYKVDSTDTGFEGREGTFTICSFWLVTTLAMIGEQARAVALAKKLLSFAGPLQLYAEEIDTATGEHLGNFPQAFTHLALIDALGRLIENEQASST